MTDEIDFTSYLVADLDYIRSRLSMLCRKFDKSIDDVHENVKHYDISANSGLSITEYERKNKVDFKSSEMRLSIAIRLFKDLEGNYKNMDVEECFLEYINLKSIMSGVEDIIFEEERRKEFFREAGKLAHSNSPKAIEKAFVKECWEKWQENPSRYKTKTAFADDMLDKCEYLKSQNKITDWCREWEAKKM